MKAANILVDKEGICKLTDFGVSKALIEDNALDNKKSLMIRGTPNWMAPESVKRLEYTRFSDIWSLGCLTIEMLTGEPPWSQYRNPMAVLFQLYNISEPPEIPSHLSPLCKDFISSCFQIEPNKRLNVNKLLKHPFLAISSNLSTNLKIKIDGTDNLNKNINKNNDNNNIISNVGSCNKNELKAKDKGNILQQTLC